MSTFLKLTHKQGNPVWINPAFVETVLVAEGSTRVLMNGTSGRFDVKESLSDVMRALGVEGELAEPKAAVAPPAAAPPAAAAPRPARRPRAKA